MHRLPLPLRAVLALLLLLAAAPAMAQATRTWVSGVGDDANPCSRTAPCRTFSGAMSKTARGGIVNVLDNGPFGTTTIVKPITIDGSGMYAGVLAPLTNGIVINIPSAEIDRRVVLRGLSIDGASGSGGPPGSPSTTGLNGIRVLAADLVLIEDTDIQNFLTSGIDVDSAAAVNVTVRDVRIVRVNGPAISVQASSGTAALDASDVTVTDSGHGILAASNSKVIAKGVHVHGARVAGFVAQPLIGSADLSVEGSLVSNGVLGVLADGAAARVTLSTSTVSGNATGLSSANGGVIASFGDNRISENGDNGAPTEELGLQ